MFDTRNEKNNTKFPSSTLVTELGPLDHLLGRGGRSNEHEANKKFRKLVFHNKRRYMELPKQGNHKFEFTMAIVQQWKEMGGRFLKQSPSHKDAWEEISDNEARKITSQKIREKGPECDDIDDDDDDVSVSLARPTTPPITHGSLVVTPPHTPLNLSRRLAHDKPLPEALVLPLTPSPPVKPAKQPPQPSPFDEKKMIELLTTNESGEPASGSKRQRDDQYYYEAFQWPLKKPKWGPWVEPDKIYPCFL